jgi:hypothetical protein
MVRIIYKLLTTLFIVISFSFNVFADMPPVPGGGPGGGDDPGGGGSPIGSGLLIMMVLGAGYGSKKIFSVKAAKN